MLSSIFNRTVDCHFEKDQNGRLVFIPFNLKGKCYFVDSKSDEEKLRGFVKLFQSTISLISWVSLPSIYLPAVFLEDYAHLTLRGLRLAFALGIPLFFWAILGTLAVTVWFVYKSNVPGVTASLSEVGPEVKDQLRKIFRRPARLALGAAVACLGLLILMMIGILSLQHVRKECPPAAEGAAANG